MALVLSASLKRKVLLERNYMRLLNYSRGSRFLSDASRVSTTVLPPNQLDSSTDDLEVETKRTSRSSVSKTSAYLQLAKARLSALVVTTTAAGFVAAGGPLSEQASLAGCCIIGTALCASSAAALNQIFEIDRDSKMKRTQQRPLVVNSLTVKEATAAAALWGISGTSILALGTDPVTTALGVGNIGLYAGLYTYMKPKSIYNTWVGAVVGAIPPVMGWTAATGGSILDVDAIILGTTLYLWQMPHFFALSYMHRIDYERGGFAMLPVLESDGERTSKVILRYAAYLSTVPIITTVCDVTSSMFALEGLVLNGYALHVAYRFRQERTNANARKVFLTSLWYLPTWLVLFLLHSKVWDEEHDKDVLRDRLSAVIHSIREHGKQACLHEHIIAKNLAPPGEEACPVALSKKISKGSIANAAASTVTSVRAAGVNKEM
jgi:protoheme IX farnesyltransferase